MDPFYGGKISASSGSQTRDRLISMLLGFLKVFLFFGFKYNRTGFQLMDYDWLNFDLHSESLCCFVWENAKTLEFSKEYKSLLYEKLINIIS